MKVTFEDTGGPVILVLIEGELAPVPMPRAFLADPIGSLRSGDVKLDDGRTEDIHLSWKDGYARMPAWQLLAVLRGLKQILAQ